MLKFTVNKPDEKSPISFSVNNHIINTGTITIPDIYFAGEKFIETERGLELNVQSLKAALESMTFVLDGGTSSSN